MARAAWWAWLEPAAISLRVILPGAVNLPAGCSGHRLSTGQAPGGGRQPLFFSEQAVPGNPRQQGLDFRGPVAGADHRGQFSAKKGTVSDSLPSQPGRSGQQPFQHGAGGPRLRAQHGGSKPGVCRSGPGPAWPALGPPPDPRTPPDSGPTGSAPESRGRPPCGPAVRPVWETPPTAARHGRVPRGGHPPVPAPTGLPPAPPSPSRAFSACRRAWGEAWPAAMAANRGNHRPVLSFHQQAVSGEPPPDVGVSQMGGQPRGSLASHLYRSCGPGRRRLGHDPVDPPHAVAAVEVYVLLEGFRH